MINTTQRFQKRREEGGGERGRDKEVFRDDDVINSKKFKDDVEEEYIRGEVRELDGRIRSGEEDIDSNYRMIWNTDDIRREDMMILRRIREERHQEEIEEILKRIDIERLNGYYRRILMMRHNIKYIGEMVLNKMGEWNITIERGSKEEREKRRIEAPVNGGLS